MTAATYNVIFAASGYNSDFDAGVIAPSNGSVTANASLVPVPPGIAMDMFSRPDQAGLGTASDGNSWSNDLNVFPSAQSSISGRRAFVQTARAYTDFDAWMGIAYRDEEVSADIDMVSVVQDPSFQHGARLLARVQGSDSWIVMALNPSNSTLTLWVDKQGNWTQIGGVTQAFQVNVWYHAKIDVIANNVYGKAWVVGQPEPGWQVSGTQTSIMTPGVGGFRTGAADAYFANYMETPITQISGKVTNASTGTGMAGVTVTLSSGATTTTDSNGNYVFSVTAGTYTVGAAPAGFNPGSTTLTVATGSSATGTNLPLVPIAPPPGPSPSPHPSPTPSGGAH